PEATAPPEE
nr:Chain B, Gag polyprotein [synthetic construct]